MVRLSKSREAQVSVGSNPTLSVPYFPVRSTAQCPGDFHRGIVRSIAGNQNDSLQLWVKVSSSRQLTTIIGVASLPLRIMRTS